MNFKQQNPHGGLKSFQQTPISVTARFHAALRLPLSCRDSRCQDNQSACDSQSDENPRPTSGPMMSAPRSQ